ncbi:FAD-binding protein [Adhaeribacter radiodurans]|uniref:FAD-binding protein n=1 Tax=Adhaeribacter radiodurans TaxID=2745197 RepID=A0A7L7L8H4_9BACT|nr:FAD-binding protein [Adhaeribacter radiodurans]QMU29098.1 FAD-binding protein [Adhaeribacter radiodurans]
MKRRPFIKLSSAATAGSALLPVTKWLPDEKIKNWAGNIIYSTSSVAYPKTQEEVQAFIKNHAKLKILGTRHCFNRIADSKDYLLSTKQLNKVISLDTQAHTVTVEGGIKYGELAPYLHEKGYALPNLASLPHISVAGSITTATHGSGVENGNLATPVVGLEIVTADGQVHTFTKEKDSDTFNGVVVGLGALGLITKVTLALQPTFQMRQFVYERLPMDQLKNNFEKIVSAGYSVSLFTDWQNNSINEVWIKSRLDDAANSNAKPNFYGATAATKNLHPIAEVSAENCTEQMGVPGPWHERLPHFKMGFTPSSGVELQSEYFVPREQAMEAIQAIARLGKQISPHLFISEIRTIAADNFWLSPCYQRPSVALHFTWKQDWPAVSKLLPIIEKELAPFNARPHWGKLFTVSPQVLASRYDKFADFKKLVAQYDPNGKFRNEFLNSTIFSS